MMAKAGAIPLRRMIGARLAPLTLVGLATITGVQGQPASDFYADKVVRIIVGHPVGGDYDQGARMLAKYLGRHLPGHPAVIVQNMPAAASVVAANFLFNRAPQDGTVFGSFSRNLASQAVLGRSGIQADLRRFSWIGGTSRPSHRVCAAWHSSRVKTTDDLFRYELIVPGGGAGSAPSIIPTVLNGVIGTKFRLVEGYGGTRESTMAMERGEVEGVCRSLVQFTSLEDRVRHGEIRYLLHLEDTPLAEYPDVPSVYNYVRNDDQRQILRFVFSSEQFVRPYVFPPNVPTDRVQTMRNAFAETLNDPELIEESKKANIDMTYQPAEGFLALVNEMYSASPELLERVRPYVPALK